MSTQILWYDEQENQKGVLTYDSAVHEEDLDGADKLTVVTRRNAAKRDRLVWKDNAGYWHEHIVDEISTTHSGGAKRHTLTCSNSISELFRIEAPGTKAKKRVSEHLADICAGTRWNAGNSSGTVVEVETWHKNVRECMTELCNQCGGELVTHIDVDDNGIVSRTVRVVVDYGTNTVKRTFTYGANMGAVKREVAADEVYTAVRGYGAKTSETAWQAHIDELEEQYDASTDSDEREKLQKRISKAREKLQAVQDDDYAERLTVEVKKGDKKRQRWGVFNGLAMVHSWYVYTDANCTDRQFLRRQCNTLLKSLCNPLVRYEFDTAEIDADMWQDVRLGSKVLCVDPVFDGGAAIERVSHIRRNLSGTMQCRIAIGKRANPQIDQYKTTQRLARTTTGNNIKTQAYTPTSSGGNYSGGNYSAGGYSPIGQYEVDGETFTIGEGTQPAAIQIVTPPNKTEYFVGTPIDYTGIVVQLLDGEGNVYTSDAYPDGIIPFDELEFPVDTADVDIPEGSDRQGTSPSGLITVNGVSFEGPIRFYETTLKASIKEGFVLATSSEYVSSIHRYSYKTHKDDVVRIARYGNDGVVIVNMSDTFNSYSTIQITLSTWESYEKGLWDKSNTSVGNAGSYSFDDHEVRYRNVDLSYENFGALNWTIPYLRPDKSSAIGAIAWYVRYGEDFSYGSKLSIPVEWNGLSDSFEITVDSNVIDYVANRVQAELSERGL